MSPTLFDVVEIINQAEQRCLDAARSFCSVLSTAAHDVEGADRYGLSKLTSDALLIASVLSPNPQADLPSLVPLLRVSLLRFGQVDEAGIDPVALASLHKVADLLSDVLEEIDTAVYYQIANRTLASSTRWTTTLQATIPDPVLLAAGIRASRRDEVWEVADSVSCHELLASDPRALRILAKDTGCAPNILRAVGKGAVTVDDALRAALLLS